MPSSYAHYRFGTSGISALPEASRTAAVRFPGMYAVGTLGPDPLFYYNPLFPTAAGTLGKTFHSQTGQEFFTNACRGYSLAPCEQALAYLNGVLSHYCLDSICHAYVNAVAETGELGHVEMEMEFDRYLVELDGKLGTPGKELVSFLRMTPEESRIAAPILPGASPKHISVGLRHQRMVLSRVMFPKGISRFLLEKGLGLLGKDYASFVINETPNPRCKASTETLMGLYRQAQEGFGALAAQLSRHLQDGTPLDQKFSPIFG